MAFSRASLAKIRARLGRLSPDARARMSMRARRAMRDARARPTVEGVEPLQVASAVKVDLQGRRIRQEDKGARKTFASLPYVGARDLARRRLPGTRW